MGLRLPARAAGAIANILQCTVTCDIALTNTFGGGSVEISLMCNGKGVGSVTVIDQGPQCKYKYLVENQAIQI